MAELKGLQIIGTIGTLSAYKRKDSDKTFLRGKGGGSKETIATSPRCEVVRNYNAEFGGRSRMGKGIRNALDKLGWLADHNISASLNTVLRPVQLDDLVNPRGERNVILSRSSHFLQGFNYNRRHPFESVVRNHIQYTMDREMLSAKVIVPELLAGINLIIPNKNPLFGFCFVLGAVPDCVFVKGEKSYYKLEDPDNSCLNYNSVTETEWFPSSIGCKSMEIELKLPKPIIAPSFTLVLGIGIMYGTLVTDGEIARVQNAGCAKVIGALGIY
jgi:hypothetical protein